jgi:hypothetical protein
MLTQYNTSKLDNLPTSALSGLDSSHIVIQPGTDAGRSRQVSYGTDKLAAFENDAAPQFAVKRSGSVVLAQPGSRLLFDARVHGLISKGLVDLSND